MLGTEAGKVKRGKIMNDLDSYVKELEVNIKGTDGGDLIGFAFPKDFGSPHVPTPNNPTMHPLPYKQCYLAKDESDRLSRAPVNLQNKARVPQAET